MAGSGQSASCVDLACALELDNRRASGGIAAAMAMDGTVMPPDSTFAISFNLATYRGEQGFSGAAVAKVTDQVWVGGGIAGSTVKGSTGDASALPSAGSAPDLDHALLGYTCPRSRFFTAPFCRGYVRATLPG